MKEIEEVRRLLQEEKDKEISRKQEELDRYKTEFQEIKKQLTDAQAALKLEKAEHLKTVEKAGGDMKTTKAELDLTKVLFIFLSRY